MGLYMGSSALTLPGLSKAYVGPEKLWPVAPALWTPSLLTSVTADFWYETLDPAAITVSSGLVAEWLDLSGNGNHLTQPNAALRPAYTPVNADFGGLPTIGAARPGDVMLMPTNPIPAIWLMADAGDGTNVYYDFSSLFGGAVAYPRSDIAAAIWSAGGLDGSDNVNWVDGVQQTTVLDSALETDPVNAGFVFMVGRVRGTSLGSFGRILDPYAAPGSNDRGTTGRVFNGPGGDQALDSDMAILLGGTGVLVPQERQLIEGYMAHSVLRPDVLPVAHPFYTSPPMASDAYVAP